MNVQRRAVIAATLGVGLSSTLAGSLSRAAALPPPTPFKGDPDAPVWPAAERFPLWPGTAPGAPATLPVANWTMNGRSGDRQLWVRGVAVPEVAVFRPARPDGSAVLSIPGGGYGFISVQNEGLDVARRFTAAGTTVFVLSYRLPGEGWADRATVPLADAQRAMRLIRARAAGFGIDPARLGALGFSAGGHLCGDLSVSAAERVYAPVDAADRLPARPAFTGLVYPVATLKLGETHGGSRDNLLGPNPSDALVRQRSPLDHVSRDTPPSFLIHAIDDDLVPVQNSVDWMAAARRAGVPVEAHFIERGGHGFGLHLPDSNAGHLWPDQFLAWMRSHIAAA